MQKLAERFSNKELGQVFTPPEVALPMVRWATRDFTCRRFLDPGVGPGTFVHVLLQGRRDNKVSSPLTVLAIDIDQAMVEEAYQANEPDCTESLLFLQADYFSYVTSNPFDAVVCNPPYLRHHEIQNKAINVELIKRDFGLSLPISTNAYCLFMLRARAMLAETARAAFIIPSEFLNSDFGVPVKDQLLKDRHFLGAVLFDFKTQVFKALTTSCILMFDTSQEREAIIFAHVMSTDELSDAMYRIGTQAPLALEAVPRSDIDINRKWRNYGKASPREFPHMVALETFARCSRGIATGANEFFTLTTAQVGALSLPRSDVQRCLTKAIQAHDAVFDNESYRSLEERGARVYLLDPQEPLDKFTLAYLDGGVERGIPERYLPSVRSPWYSQERRGIADIWVAVFSRGLTRFILNRADALNLTCFHGIYVHEQMKSLLPELALYLWSTACQSIMQSEQRQYGGGLQKYEPRDIERIRVPDFRLWSVRDKEDAAKLFAEVVCRKALTKSLQSRIDDLVSRAARSV